MSSCHCGIVYYFTKIYGLQTFCTSEVDVRMSVNGKLIRRCCCFLARLLLYLTRWTDSSRDSNDHDDDNLDNVDDDDDINISTSE
jgi:hypothetical protein